MVPWCWLFSSTSYPVSRGSWSEGWEHPAVRGPQWSSTHKSVSYRSWTWGMNTDASSGRPITWTHFLYFSFMNRSILRIWWCITFVCVFSACWSSRCDFACGRQTILEPSGGHIPATGLDYQIQSVENRGRERDWYKSIYIPYTRLKDLVCDS